MSTSAYSQGGGPGLVNHKVKVAVRLRPFIEREKLEGAKNNWVARPTEIVHVEPESQIPIKTHSQRFLFDNVFGPEATTKMVYDDIVGPIVNEAFNGFNGTVLCYGQTSSGKTHTLYGSEEDPGIISFLADDIQKRIESAPGGKVLIRLNLIEIYNELVKDLLCSENPIELVERDGTVVPLKAEHMDIFSASDIVNAAKRLQRERRIGETRMNSQSSRSHTILRMTINTFEEDELNNVENTDEEANTTFDEFETNSNPGKRIISAVLNFVDLAGSEKASQTGASGERLREAGHINTSLSALSKVVSQLSKQYETANKKESSSLFSSMCNSIEPRAPRSRMPANNTFVSYRDSKLTRLLQSSLAGDALIAIITNATPASSEETLSALRFALSAKEIQTKPKRNLITNKVDKLQYEHTIKELQAELFGKNEELKLLRLALSQKNANREELQKDETTLPDRRSTFHFRTGTNNDWRSLSMISEHEIQQRHCNTTLSADDALKEFRELTMLKSPPVVHATPASVVQTVEIEIQTDLTQDDVIPAKKRKLCSEETSTPISTLRVERSMLRVTNEEDLKNWNEEKKFLEDEIGVIKTENKQLLLDLQALKEEPKELVDQVSKINDLEQNIVSLQSELNKLEAFKSENGELRIELESLREGTKLQLDAKKSQINTLQQNIIKEMDEMEIITEENVHLKAELEALRKETNNSKDLVENVQQMTNDLADKETTIKLHEQSLNFVRKELEEMSILKTTQDSSLLELQNCKSNLEKQLLQMQQDYENNLEDLEEKVQKMTNELAEKETVIKLHEESLNSLRNELEEMVAMSILRVTHEDALKNLTAEKELIEEEIDVIKTENKQLVLDLQALQQEPKELAEHVLKINALEQNIVSLQSELDKVETFKSENGELRNELEALREETERLLDEKKSQLNALEQNFQSSMQQEMDKMEIVKAENVQLKVELEALSQETNNSQDLVEKVQQMTNQLAEKETAIKLHEQSLNSLQKELDSVEAFKNENCELRNEIEALREETERLLDEKKSQLNALEQNFQSSMQKETDATEIFKTENVQLKAELEALRKETKKSQDLVENVQQMTNDLADKETTIKLHEQSLNSLRNDLEELSILKTTQESSLQEALRERTKQLDEKKSQLIALEQNFQSSMQQEMDKMEIVKAENVQLKVELEALSQETNNSQDLVEKVQQMTNQLAEKETAIKLNEQSLNSLRKELDSVEAFKNENCELRIELESLREETERLLDEKKAQLNDLEQNIQKETDATEIFKTENVQLKAELEALKNETNNLPDLEEKVQQMTNMLAEKETIIKLHEQSLNSLRNQLEEMVERHEESLKTLTEEKELIEEEIDLIKTENKQLVLDLQVLQQAPKELAEHVSKINALEQTIISLQSELDKVEAFKSENDELRIELESLKEETKLVDAKESQLKVLEQNMQKEMDAIEIIKMENFEVKAKLETLRNETNKLQSQDLVEKVQQMTNKVAEKETAIKLQEQSLNSVRKELEEMSILKTTQDSAVLALQNCKSNLEKQLRQMQQDYENQSSEYGNLKVQLQQELQSQEAELQMLRAQNVNMKYTEKLKEDLRASWKDNKDLESNIAELTASKKEIEEELAAQLRKIQNLNLDQMKPLSEFYKLNEKVELLETKLKEVQAAKLEVESQLNLEKTKTVSLEQQLEKAQDIMKPGAKTSRGNNTPPEWDLSSQLHDCRVSLRVQNQKLAEAKKQLATVESEKKLELANSGKKIKEKEDRIQLLENHISKILKDKEEDKQKQTENGTQCEYIKELLERSQKGEHVQLPPEFPNVADLNREIKSLKNRILNAESLLKWCTCEHNAEKRNRVLKRGDPKSINPSPLPGALGRRPAPAAAAASSTSEAAAAGLPPRSAFTRGTSITDLSSLRRSSRIAKASNISSESQVVSPTPAALPTLAKPSSTNSAPPISPKRSSATVAKNISPPRVTRSKTTQQATLSSSSTSTSAPPPSSASSSSQSPAKKRRIVVRDEEEFAQRSQEFFQWLNDNNAGK